MATQYDQIWSFNMNCQKFAHEFITKALGLNWPNDVRMAGDTVPIMVDIDCISTSNLQYFINNIFI
jgi:hypothetical protein